MADKKSEKKTTIKSEIKETEATPTGAKEPPKILPRRNSHTGVARRERRAKSSHATEKRTPIPTTTEKPK